MTQTGRTIRIGTRGSKLARWQSDWVAAELAKRGAKVEIVEITTQGDVQQGPLATLDIQGVFTKEIQAAVLRGEVDLAVHSLKDLPTQQIEGLVLAATPPREMIADALVTRDGVTLEALPRGARVGTGSLRRRAQLLHLRPDVTVLGIRGNVDTRLRKLEEGEYDAIVLAAAGLKRLGLDDRIGEPLDPPRIFPAPGQGALGLECRADDGEAIELVRQLDDLPTRLSVTAERSVLAALHGGCSAPIAAWGRMAEGRLRLDALVADVNGTQVLRAGWDGELPRSGDLVERAAEVGRMVADELLEQGAAELIAAARG